MKYTLIHDTIPELLIDKVNRLIKEGWQPLGGVAVAPNDVGNLFFQAMVKTTD